MKIKELIAELSKLPQDKEVIITSMDDGFCCDNFEIHSYIEGVDAEDEAIEIILPYYFNDCTKEPDTQIFDYSVSTDGTLTVFYKGYSLIDISGCGGMKEENILDIIRENLIDELGYITEDTNIIINCLRNDYTEE